MTTPAMTAAAQNASAAAFDKLAPWYDDVWTNSVIGKLQRRQVKRTLNRVFKPGDYILELGCGTGEDACYLARSGVEIHATDASAAMLRIAVKKAQGEGVADRVGFELRSLEDMAHLEQRGPYDGAFSNFGAINCVQDLRSLSDTLAPLLRPGAPLVLCFIGRFCLWEAAWYFLHGQPAKALRRARSSSHASLSGSITPTGNLRSPDFAVYFPSLAGLATAFHEWFTLESFHSVGILVPPSYLEEWARKHPGLMRKAGRLDCRLESRPLLRGLGDHRLVILKRREHASRRAQPPEARLRFRCPSCHAQTLSPEAGGFRCAACGFVLEDRDAILRAILPERLAYYERFRREYSAVRRAEGRGSENGEYYRSLPYRDLTGRNSGQWKIRARTCRCFENRVLPGLELGRPLDVLDLGAGTGWFSYRLAQRGHRPVAVDLLTDALDGLGAAHHFRTDLAGLFPCVEAEFENLPFCDGQFDLVLFNASLHYSTDYIRTLEEARRCLRPYGAVVVLDSPIYRRREHGARMAEERHRDFERRFGFRSDSIPSREFLYDEELAELAEAMHLQWEVHRPWYGLRWHLRPWWARLKGARPPSRFNILVGRWLE